MTGAGAANRLTLVAGGALALALVEAALLRGQVIVGGDLLLYAYPRLEALGARLAAGEVPLWNPWAAAGATWFGPRAGGVLYPGNLLFALFAPPAAGALFIAMHVSIALEGARRLVAHDAPARAAFAAGLVYALGGFVTSMHVNLPYLVSAAWLPWAALGARWAAAGARRGVALGAAALALVLLACELQGALMLAGVMGAIALAPGQAAPRTRVALVAAAGVLGALLAGPQVLSVLDELPHVDRTVDGWVDGRWGVSLGALAVDLVVPGLTGAWAIERGGHWGAELFWGGWQPWCAHGVGALGLAAVVTGLLAPSHRRARAEGLALVLAGLGLGLLEAGTSLGLRFHAKWLLLSALGAARLGGVGVTCWSRGDGLRPALVVLGLTLAVAGAGVGALVVAGEQADAWLEARDPRRVLGGAARLATLWALARAGAMAAFGLALLRAWRDGRVPRAWFTAALVGLLALDLLSLSRMGVRGADRSVVAPSPLVEVLRERSPAGAPIRYESRGAALSLPVSPVPGEALDLAVLRLHAAALIPSRGYPHGVRDVDAFESVGSRARGLLLGHEWFQSLTGVERRARLDAEFFLARDAWFEAVQGPTGVETVAEVPGYPGLRLVRNLVCPPWAHVPGRTESVASLDDAVRAVLHRRRVPARDAVLGPEGAPTATAASAPRQAARAQVALVAFAPERVALRVEAASEGWLVLRDAFAAGWQATVDGAPATIARADLLFRAVRVPAGLHEVVFEYRPWWWPVGLLAMGVGALCLATFMRSDR
ncbi:MAG: YfhO family protein [Planctomycetes bacterium]|nr:YfhO family protein [Planctomycetota bacterium]